MLGDVMKSDFRPQNRRRRAPGKIIGSWPKGYGCNPPCPQLIGAMGDMIDDQRLEIIGSLYVISYKERSTLASRYIASSFIIGVTMAFFTIILAGLYVIRKWRRSF